MKNHIKMSLIATLAAALALPAIASADHDRTNGRWARIGEVGTHAHDAEDYVPVNSPQRFERIELRAEGRPVRMDDVKVQFADGRIYEVDVSQTIHPGQRVVLDVPSYSPVKMLVLDYANRGAHYRAREDARVSVRGLTSSYGDRDYDRRTDRRDYRRTDRVQRNDARIDNRFEWRGGVYVRIGG
jgi:hypothetical protein